MPGIIESSGDDPQRVNVAGVPVRCAHCGGEQFEDRHAMLPIEGKTFMGMAFVNRPATALVCAKCGHVEWFLEETAST
jgi:predicted nucleic-acid-binding Zn-ribbon protein